MKATRSCTIPECDSPARTRGLCNSHYNGMLRSGEIDVLPRLSLAERFTRRLVTMPSGCIEWTGATNSNGYGHLGRGGRREPKVMAHRLAWELARGPIPAGMHVCHSCDNPPCCNVEHLFLGTRSDNMSDMVSKGRSRGQKKTECPKGHPFDEANTRVYRGRRSCRKCGIAATARWAERKKASLAEAS